eukprot:Clim_evm28s232 gene=Clim_evmTU28s232
MATRRLLFGSLRGLSRSVGTNHGSLAIHRPTWQRQGHALPCVALRWYTDKTADTGGDGALAQAGGTDDVDVSNPASWSDDNKQQVKEFLGVDVDEFQAWMKEKWTDPVTGEKREFIRVVQPGDYPDIAEEVFPHELEDFPQLKNDGVIANIDELHKSLLAMNRGQLVFATKWILAGDVEEGRTNLLKCIKDPNYAVPEMYRGIYQMLAASLLMSGDILESLEVAKMELALEDGGEVNAHLSSELVRQLSLDGYPKETQEWVTQLRARGFKLDVEMYNSLMLGYVEQSFKSYAMAQEAYKSATDMMTSMAKDGLKPNEITFGRLLEIAMSMKERRQTVLTIAREMLSTGLYTNFRALDTIIKTFRKMDESRFAIGLWYWLRERAEAKDFPGYQLSEEETRLEAILYSTGLRTKDDGEEQDPLRQAALLDIVADIADIAGEQGNAALAYDVVTAIQKLDIDTRRPGTWNSLLRGIVKRLDERNERSGPTLYAKLMRHKDMVFSELYATQINNRVLISPTFHLELMQFTGLQNRHLTARLFQDAKRIANLRANRNAASQLEMGESDGPTGVLWLDTFPKRRVYNRYVEVLSGDVAMTSLAKVNEKICRHALFLEHAVDAFNQNPFAPSDLDLRQLSSFAIRARQFSRAVEMLETFINDYDVEPSERTMQSMVEGMRSFPPRSFPPSAVLRFVEIAESVNILARLPGSSINALQQELGQDHEVWSRVTVHAMGRPIRNPTIPELPKDKDY